MMGYVLWDITPGSPLKVNEGLYRTHVRGSTARQARNQHITWLTLSKTVFKSALSKNMVTAYVSLRTAFIPVLNILFQNALIVTSSITEAPSSQNII
jgi:hypothetical protein